MRILRVITRLDVHGGAELSTLVELEALAERGHDLAVVTVAEATTPAAVERLDAAGVEHRHVGGSLPAQARELRAMVHAWRPDVVHGVIWAAEVLTVASTAGRHVPTLVSLVNMQYAPEAVAEAPSPRRLDLLRRAEGVLLRHGIDRFHCLTEAGARHSERYLGIARHRITVIPRGRRPEDLAADPDQVAAVRAQVLGGAGALVLNVGRHESQKGQDLLLDAVTRLGRDDVRVAIAGRGGNRTAALREQVRRDGLEDVVELLGARTDVAALLGAADVVAVTSRYEGLGGSVVEALGAGAAIVAFGVPAVREVLGDAAVVVEPFDTSALADALRDLLADPDRRCDLAERARRRFAQHFDLQVVVSRLEDLYGEVAAGCPR